MIGWLCGPKAIWLSVYVLACYVDGWLHVVAFYGCVAGWLGSYVAMRLTGMCVVGLDVWLWLFVWLVV